MRNYMLVLFAWVLLCFQALPLFPYRWVEDESWYSMPAITLVNTGELRNPSMPSTDAEHFLDTRPPFMPASLAASFKMFGITPAAARAGEFLAALLTIFVVFLIGRQLGNELGGGIACIVLAADNFFVLSARTARPEAWVGLFAALTFLLLLKSDARRSPGLTFAAGLCAGCACLFHVLGIGLTGGLFAVLLWQEGKVFWRCPRFYAFAAGLIFLITPFLIWLVHSPSNMAAAKAMYMHRSPAVEQILAKERSRVSDLLGWSNQRLHLPVSFPLRLHVVLMPIAALAILWRKKRGLFWIFALPIVFYLLDLLPLPNRSGRYYAPLAWVLALAVGFALTQLKPNRWFRIAVAFCTVCLITEAAGSLLVLRQARQANYPQLTLQLREAIPAGHSCYSALTFHLALFDRQCYAYDRTPFVHTITVQKPEYMVLGDRVMMGGSGYGSDDFGELRSQIIPYAKEHGKVVAEIPGGWYGDLTVYRVTY